MKKILVTATVLSALSGAPAIAESIVISEVGSRPSGKGSDTQFVGAVVTEPIFAANEFNTHNTTHVNFAPGARTAWHTHPRGQLIIVTDGAGWVQEEGGAKRTIRAGDVVWFPPNVNHWHGATDTAAMRHIALTYVDNGSNVTWGDLVTDEQYGQ